MDELSQLIEQRPAPLPPTDAERADARARFLAHVDAAEPDRSAGGHRRRWIAMAGAAAIAVLAMVASVSGRGPGSIAPRPAAAEQLRSIAAQVETANPYPSGPYAITTRIDTKVEGGASNQLEPSGPHTTTTYSAGDGNFISRRPSCPDLCFDFVNTATSDPLIPSDGTGAEVRAGLEARVDQTASMIEDQGDDAPRPWLTLQAAAKSLQDPAMGPAGRAELLRIVAEVADLSSEPGVTSALGDTGTRFTATTTTGRLQLLVDPADGYVFELRTAGPLRVTSVDQDGTAQTDEGGTSDSTLSFGRPAAGALPADVAQLASDITAHAAQIEAPWPSGGCSGQSGGIPTADTWGIDIPDDLSFMHCWTA